MAKNGVGLVIGAVFGLIYVVVNAAALGAPVGPVLQVLGVAAFVGLLVVLPWVTFVVGVHFLGWAGCGARRRCRGWELVGRDPQRS